MNGEDVQPHNEARWVAFSQFRIGGATWNVTLREGMLKEELSDLGELLRVAGEVLSDGEQPAVSRETERRRGDYSTPGESGNNWENITRLVISGTLEKPTVEMFSSNDKLKFPFMKTPSGIVKDFLEKNYPALSSGELEVLDRCGKTINVDWLIEWQPSPKNERWKDLLDIRVPRLADAKNNGHTEEQRRPAVEERPAPARAAIPSRPSRTYDAPISDEDLPF